MNALNIGCGSRYHPRWVNLDAHPCALGILKHDALTGLPFPTESFDVVYASHLLEHFPRTQVLPFLRECFRVLRDGGVLRIVVPDLEAIARLYVKSLEQATEGKKEWERRYDWIMLELYDQTVREKPGGAILEYFRQRPVPELDFVVSRIGEEAHELMRLAEFPDVPPRGLRRLLIWIVQRLFGHQAFATLRRARRRLSGELHLWMYDRFSLASLLTNAGFERPVVRTAVESAIPGWASFRLDNDEQGRARKPDSLFMEAWRPIPRESDRPENL